MVRNEGWWEKIIGKKPGGSEVSGDYDIRDMENIRKRREYSRVTKALSQIMRQ
jgi:hypothetical protein